MDKPKQPSFLIKKSVQGKESYTSATLDEVAEHPEGVNLELFGLHIINSIRMNKGLEPVNHCLKSNNLSNGSDRLCKAKYTDLNMNSSRELFKGFKVMDTHGSYDPDTGRLTLIKRPTLVLITFNSSIFTKSSKISLMASLNGLESSPLYSLRYTETKGPVDRQFSVRASFSRISNFDLNIGDYLKFSLETPGFDCSISANSSLSVEVI